jgi:phospholipase/carboxylesterase
MAHGLFDPVVPFFLGEASRNRLTQAGHPVTWKTYAMQHSVNDDELADISSWLSERVAA